MEPEIALSRIELRLSAAADKILDDSKREMTGLGSAGPSGRQFRAAELSEERTRTERKRIVFVFIMFMRRPSTDEFFIPTSAQWSGHLLLYTCTVAMFEMNNQPTGKNGTTRDTAV